MINTYMNEMRRLINLVESAQYEQLDEGPIGRALGTAALASMMAFGSGLVNQGEPDNATDWEALADQRTSINSNTSMENGKLTWKVLSVVGPNQDGEYLVSYLVDKEGSATAYQEMVTDSPPSPDEWAKNTPGEPITDADIEAKRGINTVPHSTPEPRFQDHRLIKFGGDQSTEVPQTSYSPKFGPDGGLQQGPYPSFS